MILLIVLVFGQFAHAVLGIFPENQRWPSFERGNSCFAVDPVGRKYRLQ